MRTGTIKFNVTDRGRRFRGQDRNFDTAALAALINGGDVQERVRSRDLRGYFGHWPRSMFGMEPPEGGIHEGKQVVLEPALLTTRLKASAEGTIEHQAEFLDTAPGRSARRLFTSKAGGFSSVIAVREQRGRDVPIGFYGFDYVTEPNYTNNRGYALDAVGGLGSARVTMDDAVRESQSALRALESLQTATEEEVTRQAQILRRVLSEKNALAAVVLKMGVDPAALKGALARLDQTDFDALGSNVVRTDRVTQHTEARFAEIGLPGFTSAPMHPMSREDRELQTLIADFPKRFR